MLPHQLKCQGSAAGGTRSHILCPLERENDLNTPSPAHFTFALCQARLAQISAEESVRESPEIQTLSTCLSLSKRAAPVKEIHLNNDS